MFDKIDDEVVFFFFFLKSNATIHHLNLKHVRGSCEPEQRTAHEKLLWTPFFVVGFAMLPSTNVNPPSIVPGVLHPKL
jgi:hypothetical protein